MGNNKYNRSTKLSMKFNLVNSSKEIYDRSLHKGGPRGYLYSLDIIRGFAAIFVFLLHATFWLNGGAGSLLPNGFLCVDLFFLLSGYVISLNYDGRLRGAEGGADFFIARIARLWPLYVVSTLVGFILAVVSEYGRGHSVYLPSLLVKLVFNLIYIPALGSGRFDATFPFNAVSWSLFFEMFAYIAYYITRRYIFDNVFIFILIDLTWLLYLSASEYFSDANIGWSVDNFIGGFPRVLYSFFFGVIIQRVNPFQVAMSWIFCPLLIGLLFLICAVSPSSHALLFYQCVTLIIFPMTLVIAKNIQLTSAWKFVAEIFGGVSYSIYLIHLPALVLVLLLSKLILKQSFLSSPIALKVSYLFLILIISFFVWKYFEIPAKVYTKRYMLRFLRSKKIDSKV